MEGPEGVLYTSWQCAFTVLQRMCFRGPTSIVVPCVVQQETVELIENGIHYHAMLQGQKTGKHPSIDVCMF